MADAQLKLSRRALLGAALASPALSSHPGRDPGSMNTAVRAGAAAVFMGPGFRRDDLTWGKALARFQAADTALAAAARTSDEDLYDRLGTRHERALQRLLRTPAPTIAALALKLDLALYEDALEFLGDEAAMKALKQDARRLAAATS
jgi:hypothetical protein